MNAGRILKQIELSPDKKETEKLNEETKKIVERLKKSISKRKADAEVFVGGSFAKGTIVKSKDYDIDIFFRFDKNYENLAEKLEGLLKEAGKEMGCKLKRLHGSRDYFQISKGNITFEIIPVARIKNVKEARNVTDLSYFHVNYVKRKIDPKLANEIRLAKQFCKANGVYGAESYINGFSGYALECLIIYYGGFEKMLKELVKIEDRVIIDSARQYKNKDNILIEMNESKLRAPIILVDPTWRERNVLAALSRETFKKFQERARGFLKRPSEKCFIIKEFDENEVKEKAKKMKSEVFCVEIKTNKQEGDIAGTKMKKFAKFFESKAREFYEIKGEEFVYKLGKNAWLYLIARPKEEIIRIGPPVDMENAVKSFKRVNKNAFMKNGFIHARIKAPRSFREYFDSFKKDYSKTIKDMDVSDLRLVR